MCGEENVEIRKPCDKCEGSGFLKYEPKLCETCNGLKCIMCNSTGLEIMPWDLCNKCLGDGYFIVSDTSN